MKRQIQYFGAVLLAVTGIIALAVIGSGEKAISNYLSNTSDTLISQAELTTPHELLVQLGCNTCHTGIESNIVIRDKAPDLTFAGQRYNPAYLFSYLQNPKKIRHHIGKTRMPDFHFSPEESLALTRYLGTRSETKKQWPPFPDLPNRESGGSSVERGRVLVAEFGCLTCHTLEGEGKLVVSDLSLVHTRLKRKWVKQYLVAPYIFRGEDGTVQNYFYKISRDSTRFVEILSDAPQKINDLVNYLFSIGQDEDNDIHRNYSDFADRNKQFTQQMGSRILRSQNCRACHRMADQEQPFIKNAPNLAEEGSRVKQKWLRSYLKEPQSIRPFGYIPGSGGRMPDFKLNNKEIELIIAYFNNQSDETHFEQTSISAFAMAKAEVLLKEKLSCLGCHRLGDQGGRIGPDLSNLSSRLKPSFVHRMVNDPQETVPGTIMPKILMPPETRDLIVNYLIQQQKIRDSDGYVSLSENPVTLVNDEDNITAKTYLLYCASCHGPDGNGDGYNTQFLNVRPTQHSDPDYMSGRPDDTLFDGIFAGGYILNKSHLMPPWGATLTEGQILDLVQYMRTLCDCTGPGWSTDNQ